MNNHRSLANLHQVFFWIVSAGLVLAPLSLAPHAVAQQANTAPAATDDVQPAPPPPPPPPAAQGAQAPQQAPQAGQPGQWGPAGPPPDVQNGQIPPPPSDSGQYSQQGQYGQYSQYEGAVQVPSGPVTIPAGTLLQVRTNEPLDTKKAQPGDFFQGTIVQSVYQGRAVAIPRGAQVTGRVVDVKKAGDLKGSAGFTLELTSLNLGPQPVALATDTWSLNGPGKGAYTASNAVGGAAVGAVIGAIAGRGVGAAIGAGAGTAAGLGAAAATPGPRGVIPTEALISFHLTQPVTVQPVSQQEVRQLAQNAGPEPGQQGQYAPRVGYPGPGYPPAAYAPGYAPGYYPPPPYGYAPYPYPYAYGYPYVYAYPYGYRGYYRYGYRR